MAFNEEERLADFVIGVIEIVTSCFMLLSIANRSVVKAWTPLFAPLPTLMLPLYVSAVVTLLLAMLVMGIINLLGLQTDRKYFMMFKWFIIRFTSEYLSVFLLQTGIGMHSLYTSGMIAGLVTIAYTLIVVLCFILIGFRALLVSSCLALAGCICMYTFTLLLPAHVLSRRPAYNPYTLCTTCILLLQLITLAIYTQTVFRRHEHRELDSNDRVSVMLVCVYNFSEFLQVLLLFAAFYLDSRFWQGLYVDYTHPQLNSIIQGIWTMDSSLVNVVTDSVAQLEQGVVPLIPFNKLRIQTHTYASGGTARVYKGLYNTQEVAVKFLFCIELTPLHIHSFIQECTYLYACKHECILECIGVSIMPPALTLVTEYCMYGSLFDFLHSSHSPQSLHLSPSYTHQHHNHNPNSTTSTAIAANNMPATPQHQQQSQQQQSMSMSMGGEGGWFSRFVQALGLGLETDGVEVTSTVRASSGARAGTSSIDTGEGRAVSTSSSLDFPLLPAPPTPPVLSPLVSSSNNNKGRVMGNRESSDSMEAGEAAGLANNGAAGATPSTASRRIKGTGSARLKSPSSLLLTREMGFGLGPIKGVGERRSESHRIGGAGGGGGGRKISHSQSVSVKRHSEDSHPSHPSHSLLFISRHPPQPLLDTVTRHSNALSSSNNTSLRNVVYLLLPLRAKTKMMLDCVRGVAYLHSKGILHCDIKSLNFLVTGDLRVKLADLGEARMMTGHTSSKSLPTNINWSSPETLMHSLYAHTGHVYGLPGAAVQGDTEVQNALYASNADGAPSSSVSSPPASPLPITDKSDVWSLAMVLFEIATGMVPFDNVKYSSVSLSDFLALLRQGERPGWEGGLGGEGGYNAMYASWLKELLDQSWTFSPFDRASCAQLVEKIDEQIKSMPQ